MKKITLIVLAIAGLSLASCKKERVCECVSTSTAPGSTSTTEKVTYKKAKKSICDETSTTSIVTAPTVSGYTYPTETTTCTLK